MRSYLLSKYGVNSCKLRRFCQVATEVKEPAQGERQRVRPHPTLEVSINFTNILTALLKERKLWRAGKKIEQFVTEYQPNKIHYNQILRYYSMQRDEESALKVFSVMEEETGRDVYSYNIMMTLYGKTGNLEKAKQIFSEMDALGFLTIECYNNLLNVLAENSSYSEAKDLYNRIKQDSLPNAKTFTMLINMHSTQLETQVSKQVFEQGLSLLDDIRDYGIAYDLPLYNCVMKLFASYHGVRGETNEVINIFREMKSKGIVPDVKTFNVFFEMYCALKDETGVTSSWKAMENHNVRPTVQTFTIIIKMFAARRHLEKMHQFMASMSRYNLKPDDRLYTIVIKAYVDCKQLNMATKEIHKMQLQNLVPTVYLYSLVIKLSSFVGSPAKTLSLFREMKEHGRLPKIDLYNAILTMCMKQQNNKDFAHIFSQCTKIYSDLKDPAADSAPNKDTIDIMIKVYASSFDITGLFGVVNDCLKYQLRPYGETINVIEDLDTSTLNNEAKEQVDLLRELCKKSFV